MCGIVRRKIRPEGALGEALGAVSAAAGRRGRGQRRRHKGRRKAWQLTRPRRGTRRPSRCSPGTRGRSPSRAEGISTGQRSVRLARLSPDSPPYTDSGTASGNMSILSASCSDLSRRHWDFLRRNTAKRRDQLKTNECGPRDCDAFFAIRAGPPQERARHLLVPGPGYGRWSGLPGADALLDLVAEGLVHVLPVLEGPLQHRLGHAVEQLADDVGHQPVAGRVV